MTHLAPPLHPLLHLPPSHPLVRPRTPCSAMEFGGLNALEDTDGVHPGTASDAVVVTTSGVTEFFNCPPGFSYGDCTVSCCTDVREVGIDDACFIVKAVCAMQMQPRTTASCRPRGLTIRSVCGFVDGFTESMQSMLQLFGKCGQMEAWCSKLTQLEVLAPLRKWSCF